MILQLYYDILEQDKLHRISQYVAIIERFSRVFHFNIGDWSKDIL